MISRRTQAVLSLAGVFVLGAFCGALGFGIFVRNEVHRAQQLRDRQGFEEFFAERLRLRESQRDSLRDAIHLSYEDFAALRVAVASEYRELIDSMDHRLAPHLSDDQRLHLRQAEMRLRRGMPMERRSPVDSVAARPAPAQKKAPVPPAPLPSAPKSGTEPKPAGPQTRPPASPRLPVPAIVDTLDHPDSLSAAAATDLVLTPFAARIRSALGLSEEQASRVEEIVLETRSLIRQDFSQLEGFRRIQFSSAMRRLRDMDMQVMEILTPAQREAYQPMRRQVRQELQQRFGHWPGRGRGHGRGPGMRGMGPGMQ